MKYKNIKFRKPNGHISSYEITTLYDWLLTDEKERKGAVFTWTSGLARYIGYIIEEYYKQVKNPKKIIRNIKEHSVRIHLCVQIVSKSIMRI